METMKYEIEIVKVGSFVKEMLENGEMIIFDDCPNDVLADICYMHTPCEIKSPIEVGDTITIGKKAYAITAIGEEAIKTLTELGHCSFKFNGADKTELPGQIELKGDGMPDLLEIGDKIIIE